MGFDCGEYYRCTSKLLPGHRYSDVMKIARRIFREIESKSKRRAYIRSTYFNGEKIFFENFWVHLRQKLFMERFRRLKYFECALELLKCSRVRPIIQLDNKNNNAVLYRFLGTITDFLGQSD